MKKVILVLLCGVLMSACGKKDKNNKPQTPASDDVEAEESEQSSELDQQLVGKWAIEAEGFKYEKTINKDGSSEEKIWGNGTLGHHLKSKITQQNDGDNKRFTDEILSVEVSEDGIEGAEVGVVLKCLYEIKEESGVTVLTVECNDGDFPASLTEEANVLPKVQE